MSNVSHIESSIIQNMVPKQLDVADVYKSMSLDSLTAVRGHTYTTRDDGFPPTPVISSINPFNDRILASSNVLEIGAGLGRNLPFVMEQIIHSIECL